VIARDQHPRVRRGRHGESTVCGIVAISAFEAYLVTPTILSRRLTINPIAVFLSVIFWGRIWGIPGALIAVPIMTCNKVMCDNTVRLPPVSQFLSGRRLR